MGGHRVEARSALPKVNHDNAGTQCRNLSLKQKRLAPLRARLAREIREAELA
jgi:hypothetical protein